MPKRNDASPEERPGKDVAETAPVTGAVAGEPIIANNRVFVIESSYNFRDSDNRDASEEEILVDEGWFADKDSAEIRCDQLNAGSRTHYDNTIDAAKRSHDQKIRRAKEFNREAAVLRDAGIPKTDVVVPPAYEPPTYTQFLRSTNHTTHTVVEVLRADHDGIAQAIAAGADAASVSTV